MFVFEIFFYIKLQLLFNFLYDGISFPMLIIRMYETGSATTGLSEWIWNVSTHISLCPWNGLKVFPTLNFLCIKGPFLHYDLVSFLAKRILETYWV